MKCWFKIPFGVFCEYEESVFISEGLYDHRLLCQVFSSLLLLIRSRMCQARKFHSEKKKHRWPAEIETCLSMSSLRETCFEGRPRFMHKCSVIFEGDGLWWDRFIHSYVFKYRACTPKEECEKLEQGYFSFAMWLPFKGTWSVVTEIYYFKLGNLLIKLWTSRRHHLYTF